MAERTIAVRLWANVGEFKAQLAVASRAVTEMGASMNTASAEVTRGTKLAGAAMAAVGAAAVATAALSAKAAVDLQTQMQNVATIWNESAMSITDAGHQIVAMSTTLPQSASTLAKGLYDIASAGFEGADAMNILRASATAASAGMTDTATAARVIDGAIHAYGLTASDAGRVSDALFATVKYGIVTFEQLANTMGDFMGTASALNLTIEETGSSRR